MSFIDISRFSGINIRVVDSEGNVTYFRNLINFSISKVLGRLLKRKGYEVIASDIGNDSKIIELIDISLVRQLIVHASNVAGLIKKVWTGAGYGAVEPIDNSAMPVGFTINKFYPVTYMNTLYSGAGLGDTDFPFFVQHIKEWTKKTGATDITIDAKLYVLPAQIEADSISFDLSFVSASTGSESMELGLYKVNIYPVFTDGTVGNKIGETKYITKSVDDDKTLNITINEDGAPVNIRGVDVFISFKPDGIYEDINFPFYFLERVSFENKIADKIHYYKGLFKDDSTYGYGFYFIDIPVITFNPAGMIAFFSYGGTDYELEIDSYQDISGTQFLEFVDTIPSELLGKTITVNIAPSWVSGSITIVYDAYYNNLTTEISEYLNLPKGLTLIPDYRYEFAAIAGRRLFTFRTDSIYAYFSPVDAFNVFTYSNEVILKDTPIAAVAYMDGVYVFSKKRAEFIRVTAAGVVVKEENSLQFGAISQESIVSTGNENIYVMSRSGIWHISPRGERKISEFIQGEVQADIVLSSIDESELDTCRALYNPIRRELQFHFQTVEDGNICYIFDLAASEMLSGAETWIKYGFDRRILGGTINNDAHQLLVVENPASNEALANFNSDTPTEDVGGEIEVKGFDSNLTNKKVRFNRILIKTNDVSQVNLNVRLNDTVNVSRQPDETGEAYVRAIARDMKIFITTPPNTEEFYIDKIQIEYTELNR